jgi:hypothetical protein
VKKQNLVARLGAVLPGSRARQGGRRLELAQYRSEVLERTGHVAAVLGRLIDDVDELRRRLLEPDEALARLTVGEAELDQAAEELRDIRAPKQLHDLHREYEANLERALRGIVTVERSCILTHVHHRRVEEEEVGYTRGHLNMIHAQMRMGEVASVLADWAPGKPTTADVRGRVHRPPE